MAQKIRWSPGDCTYPLIGVRQNVYACLKCSQRSSEHVDAERGHACADVSTFGFCVSCRDTCHAQCGEDAVVELLSKRNFRCDCGTDRTSPSAAPCRVLPAKTAAVTNRYNHNFHGWYCRCQQPEHGEMFQCAMCEDWFHEQCLLADNGLLKAKKTCRLRPNFELTCAACSEAAAPILQAYYWTTSWTPKEAPSRRKRSASRGGLASGGDGCCAPRGLATQGRERAVLEPARSGDLFWKPGWRRTLCTCSSCLELYESFDVAYLVDPNDLLSSGGEQDGTTGLHLAELRSHNVVFVTGEDKEAEDAADARVCVAFVHPCAEQERRENGADLDVKRAGGSRGRKKDAERGLGEMSISSVTKEQQMVEAIVRAKRAEVLDFLQDFHDKQTPLAVETLVKFLHDRCDPWIEEHL